MKRIVGLIVLVAVAMMVSGNILSSQERAGGEGEGISQEHPMEVGFWSEHPFAGGPGFGPGAMKRKHGCRKGECKGELERKVMDIVSKNDQSFAQKLEELKKTNPQKYRQLIKLSFNLLELAKENEIAEKDVVRGIALEYDTRELASKYNKADPGEKEKIKREIKNKLNELFDIRTKVQELKVERLQAKVKELKDIIEKRKQNKSKIIEERLNDLLKDKTFKW